LEIRIVAQFVSPNPNIEVYGASMLSVIDSLGEKVKPLLVKHGLDNINPEQWYPLQPYLDFYKDVASARFNAALNLVRVGLKVPEKAVFPEGIDSIPKALSVLDEAYYMNHRGGDIGHYRAQVIHSRQIDMVVDTPFPCDLDFGIVQGLARRFEPANSNLAVYHDHMSPCRKKGSDHCVYHVIW
jgi:hypothetical protein